MRFTLSKTGLSIAAVASLALLSSACTPNAQMHGYLPIDARPSTDIKVGDTVMQVRDRLGPPSQTSAYDPNEWYYIDQTNIGMTYKPQQVVSRNVTVIKFDKDSNTVASVETLTLADGRQITPDSRTTPTRGRSLSALEQILGTVGAQRIDNSQDRNPGNQRRRD